MKGPRSIIWRRLLDRDGEKAADCVVECGIFPFIDWNSEFKPACEWHDEMYLMQEQGILPADYTRERVDAMFFRQCLQLAGRAFEETGKGDLYAKAAKYYLVVRWAGGFVW